MNLPLRSKLQLAMKLHFTALALCTMIAPALAQPQPATPTTISYLQPVETNFGWRITPVVLPEDNAAAMFGMKFWRFKVESPDEKLKGTYTLELRRYRQEPITIHQGEFEFGGNVELTFGLMPKGEESLWEADEIKFSSRFRLLDQTPSTNDGANVTICKNPVKEITSNRIITGYAGVGEIKSDGSVVLTRFLVGETLDKGENRLVLVFDAKD